MTHTVRDGVFDVAIVAGPRIQVWPSVGVRVLSALCAEMGLTVGIFGGPSIQVKGVLPLPGTGGLVLVQDPQERVHRIRAKAVVRMTLDSGLPNPFQGWLSPAVIPIQTAYRLLKESDSMVWAPAVAVLGSGNRALQLGARFLEMGVPTVYCIESSPRWGLKRYAGWEVHRRRFEMAGGKIIEVKPRALTQKASQLWELRLEDSLGIRVVEVSRVVAVGPYGDSTGVREYPPGSLLFELEQTADPIRSDEVEGYQLEEERGRTLGVKIVRALSADTSLNREELERLLRRARSRLRASVYHRDHPLQPKYQGKWMDAASTQAFRRFEGVPQTAQKSRFVASLECVEGIPCNLCEKACPESAIKIQRSSKPEERSFLIESDCTACGLCLPACPSGAAFLMKEEENKSFSKIIFHWRGATPWKEGEFATLLNRRGDPMGQARIMPLPEELPAIERDKEKPNQFVCVEVPSHLVWEARGLRRLQTDRREQPGWNANENQAEARVHIMLNGEKRLARESATVLLSLFEMGVNRREDMLYCPDGSCQLCHISVDGVKKLACQTKVRKGMSIRTLNFLPEMEDPTGRPFLCACLKLTQEEVLERVRNGKLSSVEAALAASPVGEGKCHGQLCASAFERLLCENGLDAKNWTDWRFPWTDWVFTPGNN